MPYIELDRQTADNLEIQARLQGLTVPEYLNLLIPPSKNAQIAAKTLDELDVELDDLVLELPTLPGDFSRADIYDEHD